MSTIPAPVPTPRPQPPVPYGPAGARPTGPAGTGPTGPGGSHPGILPGRPPPITVHVRRLVAAFVELFLEVEAGRRPPGHLAPLLSPLLYARLRRVWFRGGRPGRLISVTVVAGQLGVFDAIAVVRRGRRSGAISLRIARTGLRWRIEDLARPEDGPLPPPEHPVADEPPPDDDDAEIPLVAVRPDPGVEPDWLTGVPAG